MTTPYTCPAPDAPTLRAAGWRLATRHGATTPALIAPDGEAIGDADIVEIDDDGALCPDYGEGPIPDGPDPGNARLVAGIHLRQTLEGEHRR